MKRIDIELIKEIKLNNVKAIDKLKEKKKNKGRRYSKTPIYFLEII